VIFFDTSAIVKGYASEPGSPAIHGAPKRLPGKLYLTDAVVLEVLGALAKKQRKGELTEGEYRSARTRFLNELGGKLNVIHLREIDFTTAFQMVDTYRHVGAGPIDVLHIVSALHLRAGSPVGGVTVASSDGAFLGLARAAGLATFDPETDPLAALLALER
jgi:predicted nucleic acid-binding protein